LHGKYAVFYPEGDTMTSGRYAGDVKDGKWRYYNEEQKLIKTEVYQKGTLVEQEQAEE
jgi:antitoxin component YwqK of YwqJK toxin-antitoxin module